MGRRRERGRAGLYGNKEQIVRLVFTENFFISNLIIEVCLIPSLARRGSEFSVLPSAGMLGDVGWVRDPNLVMEGGYNPFPCRMRL